MCGEIGFYLSILGGTSFLSGRIFYCCGYFYLHFFSLFAWSIFKSEVMKRKGKFQAFPERLHDVALIHYKVREGILQKDGCKRLFKFKKMELSQCGWKTVKMFSLRKYTVSFTDIVSIYRLERIPFPLSSQCFPTVPWCFEV